MCQVSRRGAFSKIPGNICGAALCLSHRCLVGAVQELGAAGHSFE